MYIITDKDYVTSQSKRQIVMVHTSCKNLPFSCDKLTTGSNCAYKVVGVGEEVGLLTFGEGNAKDMQSLLIIFTFPRFGYKNTYKASLFSYPEGEGT